MLALGLARVSPSGKARASQARMRGFESRHPLQKKLRPVFSSELCPYVAVHLETGFLLRRSRLYRPCQGYTQMSIRPCLHSSLTGFPHCPRWRFRAFFAGFALLWQFDNHENKNLGFFATFLRLRTLFRSLGTKKGHRTANYLRFCVPIRD